MGQATEGTWDQLKLHPTELVKLVVEGKAKILGKDKFGRYIYRLDQLPERARTSRVWKANEH